MAAHPVLNPLVSTHTHSTNGRSATSRNGTFFSKVLDSPYLVQSGFDFNPVGELSPNPHVLKRPDRGDPAVCFVGFTGGVLRTLLERRLWGLLLVDYPVDSGSRDTMSPGDLAEDLAVLAVPKDSLAIQVERWTADVLALMPGAPHAGAHSFSNEAPLEFGDRADDDDDSPAQRPAGVNLLVEADELDVEPAQLVQHFQKMTSRASDAIASPDHHDIGLAAAGIGHHLIEAWPPSFGAADSVGLLMHDIEAALVGHLPEVVQLRLRVLVKGADPHIQDGAFHPRRPFFRGVKDRCLAAGHCYSSQAPR